MSWTLDESLLNRPLPTITPPQPTQLAALALALGADQPEFWDDSLDPNGLRYHPLAPTTWVPRPSQVLAQWFPDAAPPATPIFTHGLEMIWDADVRLGEPLTGEGALTRLERLEDPQNGPQGRLRMAYTLKRNQEAVGRLRWWVGGPSLAPAKDLGDPTDPYYSCTREAFHWKRPLWITPEAAILYAGITGRMAPWHVSVQAAQAMGYPGLIAPGGVLANAILQALVAKHELGDWRHVFGMGLFLTGPVALPANLELRLHERRPLDGLGGRSCLGLFFRLLDPNEGPYRGEGYVLLTDSPYMRT